MNEGREVQIAVIAACLSIVSAVVSSVGVYAAVSISGRPNLGMWTTYLEPISFTIAGGLLAELMAWHDWDKKNPGVVRKFTVQSLLLKSLIVLAGAIITLAYLRSGQTMSPIFAIQVGATTPIILKQLIVSANESNSSIRAETRSGRVAEVRTSGAEDGPIVNIDGPEAGEVGELSGEFKVEGPKTRRVTFPLKFSLRSSVVSDEFQPEGTLELPKKKDSIVFRLKPMSPGPRKITLIMENQKGSPRLERDFIANSPGGPSTA